MFRRGTSEEEVTEPCRVASAAAGLYATHTRNRDEAAVEAADEAIRTAERADATALAPDGALAGSTFHGAYTWASWFYRRMVRETGTFTPEEGLRKFTGLPAEKLRLSDRGVIRQGARADLAIFDADAFGETGTTFEPNQIAKGMNRVVANGVVTLRDGVLTGERGGVVPRRPSRPALAAPSPAQGDPTRCGPAVDIRRT